MSEYGGFIYAIENKEEAKKIDDFITNIGFFTDPLPLGNMRPNVPEISLISLSGDAFTHASLMIPKREAGSIKHMMSFSNCISLPQIGFAEISHKLGGVAWSKVRAALPASGRSERLDAALWETLIETLKDLQPNIADKLTNLENLRKHGFQERSGPGFNIMALEKDIVGTFLDIAGFERKQEFRVQLTDKAAPFLKNVVGSKTLEEYSITHDMLVIGNIHPHFKSYQGGVIEYTKRTGGKLTVMNVNNTDIEHTMGVDAILYDHRYHSYLMIQCKRMNDESARDIGYRFYEHDKNQIKQMQQFEHLRSNLEDNTVNMDSYRLHPGCFYLRLSAPETYTPLSPDLMRGLFLPLDLWPIVEASPHVTGSNKGSRVSYTNTRYLNNTLFSDLAQYGWIGTKQSHTDALTEELIKIIQITVDAKKSAMIGEIKG